MIATTDQSRKRKLQLLPEARDGGKGWRLRLRCREQSGDQISSKERWKKTHIGLSMRCYMLCLSNLINELLTRYKIFGQRTGLKIPELSTR